MWELLQKIVLTLSSVITLMMLKCAANPLKCYIVEQIYKLYWLLHCLKFTVARMPWHVDCENRAKVLTHCHIHLLHVDKALAN